MHLLAAKPGSISDGSVAIDLGQIAGRYRFSVFGRYRARLPGGGAGPAWGRMRRACGSRNLLQLGHNLSVDLYVETRSSRMPGW